MCKATASTEPCSDKRNVQTYFVHVGATNAVERDVS